MDKINYSIVAFIAVCLILIPISAISADSDFQITVGDRTFSAAGNAIGYSADAFSNAILTREANAQLMQFDVENQNHPVRYNVTISQSDYDQLKSAKNQGEIKEIQIETNQSVIVKEPVTENYTIVIFSNDYYDDESFDSDLKILEERFLFDSDVDVNVTTHANPSNFGDYKEITVYRTFHVVNSFDDRSEQITAHVVVNDMQANGGDWVFFHAPSLGIGGVMASSHINI